MSVLRSTRTASTNRGALLALLFAICASTACAETLAEVDWFERPLGDGVVWRYYRFDDYYGAKQSIAYIEADLGNPNVSVEFPYLAASRGLTSSMVPAQFPGRGGRHQRHLLRHRDRRRRA